MNEKPSLENLIEAEDIGVESFHPGGTGITRELARLCRVGEGTWVLDVASGTGETACFLAGELGARVTGVDMSEQLLSRARDKAAERTIAAVFLKGDAEALDFADNQFDVVISECTLCLLDKDKVLAEMVRVAKPGGRVGIHDVCWKAGTPQRMKERLEELEGERPESMDDWKHLFERAGLADVRTVDRSELMPGWVRSVRRQLGLVGQLRIFARVVRLWGLSGVARVLESERIFDSRHIGYGIIVGTKPVTASGSAMAGAENLP